MTQTGKPGISIFVRMLIVFLCVNIVTSGILLVIAFGFHRQSMEERTKEAVTQQLEILRDNFENEHRLNLKRSLDVLASSSILDDYLTVSRFEKAILQKKIEQMFVQALKTYRTYHSIRFVDADGNVSISVTGRLRQKEAVNLKQSGPESPPLPPSLEASKKLFETLESIPLLLSGGYMEWFMPPRELQLEGPYVDEDGALSLLGGVSKLDLDVGEFGGVLMIQQKLDPFLEGLRDVRFFNENPIWVFDARGRLLQSPENVESRLDPADYLSGSFQKTSKLIDTEMGLVAYRDFSIVPGEPFVRVVISIPTTLLFKDFASAVRFFTIVLVCSVIVVLLLALYVSRYLSKPIVELANAANRVAEGDLTVRVKVATTGEVQTLVNSFNHLTEELQQTILLNVRLDEAAKGKEELEQINRELEGARQSLAEREQRYRTLTGNLPGIVYRVDLESGNRLTFFNDMLHPMTGYDDNDLVQTDVCPLESMIVQEDRGIVVSNVRNAISRMEPFEIEYRVTHRDGGVRHFLERGRPVYDSGGQSRYIDGVILDVTEREAAEIEKRRLESQLQRALKMEAVGTLAGGVAHDLNNILSGIVGFPDLLLMQIPDDSPLRRSILTIKKSGEKAAAVVNDLLTLARRGVADMEAISLNDCVNDYLGSPEFEILRSDHPGVDLETSLDENLLNIMASPVHISKVVMNLVSNAAEAIPDSGTIRIATECRYLDRPVSGYDNVSEGDYVVFAISDNGKGISPEDIESIFEPFYTKKKMGRSGTGLGLAVVWGVVKDLNGYIDVRSTDGEGTTFTLYLPVSRADSVRPKAEQSLDTLMGRGESILVVDDVEEQRQIASGMLEALGYPTASVPSGEDAVEYVKENPVDLLVLDMIMDPGIDGLDTYKRIVELRPGQKAVIASGFSDTDRVKETQRLGAGPYVRKPYTIEKIGMAVKSELEKAI